MEGSLTTARGMEEISRSVGRGRSLRAFGGASDDCQVKVSREKRVGGGGGGGGVVDVDGVDGGAGLFLFAFAA